MLSLVGLVVEPRLQGVTSVVLAILALEEDSDQTVIWVVLHIPYVTVSEWLPTLATTRHPPILGLVTLVTSVVHLDGTPRHIRVSFQLLVNPFKDENIGLVVVENVFESLRRA